MFRPIFYTFPQSVQSFLNEVVNRSKPKTITIFGSRARGTARPNSDFDFSVKNRSCSNDEWIRLLVDLHNEPYTLHAVDLVADEDLGTAYKETIQKEGIIVYESNP